MPKSYERPIKEKQAEFFNGFQATAVKRAGHSSGRDIAFGKKFTLQLSYENIILLFIAFIMLLVMFFALGVERGKRITPARALPGTQRSKEADELKTADLSATASQYLPEPVKGGVELITSSGDKPYTIQVVAFKDGKKAERKVDDLKKGSYDAFIIPSGEWFQVCVGSYTNKEEAKRDFEALGAEYPTRYLRERPPGFQIVNQ